MQKNVLNCPLYEGVNRFTVLTPGAGEIGDQALLCLYVFPSNQAPDFTEGSVPTLAAVDDNTEYLDAEGFDYVGYRSGDATYFQAVNGIFMNQTLAFSYENYVVRITYFNMIGDNDPAINPQGVTSAASTGYISAPAGGWGIDSGADDALGYLEIVVEQASPQAAGENTNLFVGIYQDSGRPGC